MDLIEWATAFIDNLNSFRHDLEKKEIKGNEIDCIYKVKGPVKYIIEPDIKQDILNKLGGNTILVCLNRKDNLDFMIKNWDDFRKNPKLKVIFANPKTNEQWSLIPCTHHMISDPKNLKPGLKSVFETIPEY
jgi:hypothetical protein